MENYPPLGVISHPNLQIFGHCSEDVGPVDPDEARQPSSPVYFPARGHVSLCLVYAMVDRETPLNDKSCDKISHCESQRAFSIEPRQLCVICLSDSLGLPNECSGLVFMVNVKRLIPLLL